MTDCEKARRSTELRKELSPPIRAENMLFGLAIFVRDMLTHDHAALYDTYGLRPAEAEQSLRYVELAELRLWGIDEMVEAVIPNQALDENALRRRIAMALKADSMPDFVRPGDAILLMERSGLLLNEELRGAVVYMTAGFYGQDIDGWSDQDENRLRSLLGRPLVNETGTTHSDALAHQNRGSGGETSKPRTRNTWDAENLARLQNEALQPGITHQKLAIKYGVKRQMIGKLLAKADSEFRPQKAAPFDLIMKRNRK